MSKECTRCKKQKNESEYYKISKSNKSGVKVYLMGWCIDCHKKYSIMYREINKAKEADRKSKWKSENIERYREKYKKYNHEYYLKNKSKRV